jgi:hypothetical protein
MRKFIRFSTDAHTHGLISVIDFSPLTHSLVLRGGKGVEEDDEAVQC